MAKKTNNLKQSYIWGSLRISLGAIFLWAFVDKLFGLGFATCRSTETNSVQILCDKAWTQGGSPTTGFLKFGTQGPFAESFQSLAGNGFVDVLFMAGLLGIGLALILGIGMRIATVSGVAMMIFMWLATLWPANNPVLDDHIIYSIALIGLLAVNDNQKLGLGKRWQKLSLVKKYPILR